ARPQPAHHRRGDLAGGDPPGNPAQEPLLHAGRLQPGRPAHAGPVDRRARAQAGLVLPAHAPLLAGTRLDRGARRSGGVDRQSTWMPVVTLAVVAVIPRDRSDASSTMASATSARLGRCRSGEPRPTSRSNSSRVVPCSCARRVNAALTPGASGEPAERTHTALTPAGPISTASCRR